jgi:hypothetical protein
MLYLVLFCRLWLCESLVRTSVTLTVVAVYLTARILHKHAQNKSFLPTSTDTQKTVVSSTTGSHECGYARTTNQLFLRTHNQLVSYRGCYVVWLNLARA